jgi:hypothetical protein
MIIFYKTIDSFLRGVYINVGEIFNSDWLKRYIYFPYTPTQLISKNVKKQEDGNRIRNDEKCCVCKLFTPKEIRESPCLIFTKWLQCDQCKHWVHLIYSTKKRVIKKGDVFLCP